MADALLKRPAESRLYGFDFSKQPEIVAGDTLTGVPIVTADITGLTLGTPSVLGASKAQCQISGGTDGTQYRIYCQCGTVAGATLQVDGVLKVEK